MRKWNILKVTIKYMVKGYSFSTAKGWGRKVAADLETHNGKSKQEKKWAHKRGFLSDSVDRYNLTEKNYKEVLSDFEYTFLNPINNAYLKWLTDRLTPRYILQNFDNVFPKLYYNIIQRDGEEIIISLADTPQKVTVGDVVNCLKEKGKLVVEPSQVAISSSQDEEICHLLEYIDGDFFVDGKQTELDDILNSTNKLENYAVVREYTETRKDIKQIFNGSEAVFNFILINESMGKSEIICCYAQMENKCEDIIIDKNYEKQIPDWENICELVVEMSTFMSEIEYMMLSVQITDDGIKIIGHNPMPKEPAGIERSRELNEYLKDKLTEKHIKLRKGEIKKITLKWRVLHFLKKHYFRQGFREYMLAVWLNIVKDDLFNTDLPLRKKLWAWKRGFPSYRIEQYGLTEENWKDALSDYEYAWLNRINNGYQKWINDKNTMRYVLDHVNEYLPEYYFFIGKRNGITRVKKLQDCPQNCTATIDGIFELLKEKDVLALKPNAGTHGDGFYKLEYAEDKVIVNGEELSKDEFADLIDSYKSTYIITEYIVMHKDLKKIYPKSVNTVRIMVLNPGCDNAEIKHAYMRIGSAKTGFTDNVGYGGICCYVDCDTGRYYGGETISNHKFHPCNVHPDTGIEINGYIPHWDVVIEGIERISMEMPQLEYLGYDIAITENGFKIIEINIHQDLHKYVKYPEDVKAFFKKKLELKREKYNIKL